MGRKELMGFGLALFFKSDEMQSCKKQVLRGGEG